MSGISYHHSAIAVRLRHASTQHCLIYANGSITSSSLRQRKVVARVGLGGKERINDVLQAFNRQMESRTWLPPRKGLLCVRSTRVHSKVGGKEKERGE